MAITSVQPAAAPANPSRRAALGIIATGPVALLPSLAVMSCSSEVQAAISPSLHRAISRYRILSDSVTRWHNERAEPALKAFRQEADALPHYQTTRSYLTPSREAVTLSTEDGYRVRAARRMIEDAREGAEPSDYLDAQRELVALADRREAELAEIRARHGVDRINAMDSRYGDALLDAKESIINHEPRSMTDLAAKSAFISELDLWGDEDAGEAIARDIAALARRV